MVYILHDITTGAMLAEATTLGALPDGVGAVPYETAPDWTRVQWDAVQRMLVPRAVTRTTISRGEALERLGEPCRLAVQMASVTFPNDDPATQQLKAQLRDLLLSFTVRTAIDVTSPEWIAGVDTLIANGFLAPARRELCLALPEEGD